MLTSDLDAPEVTETSVLADLFEALEILTELGVDHVRDELRVGAVARASLSVQEERGDAVLGGLGDDVVNLVDFIFSQITGSAVQVDLGNLEHEVGESAANTLNDADGEHGLVLAVDVRVLHTQEVSEFVRSC